MFYRTLFSSLLLIASAVSGGCAVCCSTDDYTYSTYGGKWERGDRTHGRVGSIFSGAGAGSTMTYEGEYIEGELPVTPVPELPGPNLDVEPISHPMRSISARHSH